MLWRLDVEGASAVSFSRRVNNPRVLSRRRLRSPCSVPLNAANWPSARGQTPAAARPAHFTFIPLRADALPHRYRFHPAVINAVIALIPLFIPGLIMSLLNAPPPRTPPPPQPCIISWTAWLRVWIRFSLAQFREYVPSLWVYSGWVSGHNRQKDTADCWWEQKHTGRCWLLLGPEDRLPRKHLNI